MGPKCHDALQVLLLGFRALTAAARVAALESAQEEANDAALKQRFCQEVRARQAPLRGRPRPPPRAAPPWQLERERQDALLDCGHGTPLRAFVARAVQVE